MPPDPHPRDAAINVPHTTVTVLFSTGLLADPALDVLNWFMNFGGTNYTITAAVAAGATVTLTVVDTLFPGAPPGLSYFPPPFDVIGVGGNPAQAFADFPVHP